VTSLQGVIGAKDDIDSDDRDEEDSDAGVSGTSSGEIEAQKHMETFENIVKIAVKSKDKIKVADSWDDDSEKSESESIGSSTASTPEAP
jgi:hypothetical protein